MPKSDRTIKAGDTWPPFTDTLTDKDGPIDLTNADTVSFALVPVEGGTAYSGAATVTDAETGAVEYLPPPEQTSTPGLYRCGWVIDWGKDVGKDRIQTVPNTGAEWVLIEQGMRDVS